MDRDPLRWRAAHAQRQGWLARGRDWQGIVQPDLPEKERLALFSGHPLRAGRASSAEGDERHVPKHLAHASVEITRRCQQRPDTFPIKSDQGGTAVGRRPIHAPSNGWISRLPADKTSANRILLSKRLKQLR